MKEYIKNNPIINISRLEEACGVPPITLHHWINGTRGLPIVHEQKVLEVLIKYTSFNK